LVGEVRLACYPPLVPPSGGSLEIGNVLQEGSREEVI